MDFATYPQIPAHTRDALILYVEHGIPPGGFLTSVLSNDLMGAVGRADVFNLAAIPVIAKFIYNEMPANSHGSLDRVEEFCRSAYSKSKVAA